MKSGAFSQNCKSGAYCSDNEASALPNQYQLLESYIAIHEHLSQKCESLFCCPNVKASAFATQYQLLQGHTAIHEYFSRVKECYSHSYPLSRLVQMRTSHSPQRFYFVHKNRQSYSSNMTISGEHFPWFIKLFHPSSRLSVCMFLHTQSFSFKNIKVYHCHIFHLNAPQKGQIYCNTLRMNFVKKNPCWNASVMRITSAPGRLSSLKIVASFF